MVCWLTDAPLQPGQQALRSSTPPARARAMVKDLQYRLDVNTLHRDEGAGALALNEIGRVDAAHDRSRCSSTSTAATGRPGGFILVDEATNDTVAAGMVMNAD